MIDLFLSGMPEQALAYIGPGPGLSLIGAFFMFLFGLLLTVALVLLWPLRMLWKKFRKKKDK